MKVKQRTKPGPVRTGYFCTLLLVAFSQLSCNKTLDNIQPTNVASENLQWKSITDTRAALFGIYGLCRAALANNDCYWIYGDLRMGDFASYSRLDLDAVIHNNLTQFVPTTDGLADWRRFYAIINAAAVFIEHAPQVVLSDPLYSQANLTLDIAQARALRAFTYFYIARIWGDVPLITQAYDNGTFPLTARSSQQQVLDYASQELLAVVDDLPYQYGVSPQTYYGSSTASWNGVLFNKISAYAVLAHIAAWQSKYLDVEVYTNFIMTNYTQSAVAYSTIDGLTNATTGIFATRSSSQIIAFNFMDALGESTSSGHIEELTLASPFVPKQNPDMYVPTDSINAIFTDSNDVRFGIDTTTGLYRTNYFTNFSSATPIFSKIKVVRARDYPLFGSAIVFTRLEEIVLLRAEALAVLNRLSDAVAALNTVKTARGEAPYIQGVTTDNIVDDIFSERRRELMGEGWRWYDQVRYNRIRQLSPAFTNLITKQGIYWPVSQSALDLNKLITQNSYWQ
jgi:hypothetical protein